MAADRFEEDGGSLPALARHRAQRAGVEHGEAGVGERGSAEGRGDREDRHPPRAASAATAAAPTVAAGEIGPSARPAASAKRTTWRGWLRAAAVSPRAAATARALTPAPARAAPRGASPRSQEPARAPRPTRSRRVCSRYSRIAAAMPGPMPSSSSSCSGVAVLRSSGTPSAGPPPAAAAPRSGTTTWRPSSSLAARLSADRSARRRAPPARRTASTTRARDGSR